MAGSDPSRPLVRWPSWARVRVTVLVTALLFGLAATVAVALWQRHAAEQRRQGQALFHGEIALPARLPAHAELLPTLATRCSNCHEQINRVPVGSASGAAGGATEVTRSAGATAEGASSYALALTRDGLTRLRPRRGGPPSAYDNASFCQLLRSGADPARVIIANDMPRYEASNEQCQQLWAYLLDR